MTSSHSCQHLATPFFNIAWPICSREFIVSFHLEQPALARNVGRRRKVRPSTKNSNYVLQERITLHRKVWGALSYPVFDQKRDVCVEFMVRGLIALWGVLRWQQGTRCQLCALLHATVDELLLRWHKEGCRGRVEPRCVHCERACKRSSDWDTGNGIFISSIEKLSWWFRTASRSIVPSRSSHWFSDI